MSVWTHSLQGAIKVADIGHVYADRDVHIRWAERLEEEMWRQGDLEKHRDLKEWQEEGEVDEGLDSATGLLPHGPREAWRH